MVSTIRMSQSAIRLETTSMAGTAKAVETPIGNLPTQGGLDVRGLDIGVEDLEQLLRVDLDGWLAELPLIQEYYDTFGDRMPQQLVNELEAMRERLESAKS